MAISSSGIWESVTLVRTNRQRNQGRETPRKEGVMPARKRKRRERTHDWQAVYERLRPVVLFGETAAERAKETGASERTLHYQARRFEQEGMASHPRLARVAQSSLPLSRSLECLLIVPVIHQHTDGGTKSGSDLDQVELPLAGDLKRPGR
jgi:hypothetical protein